MFKEKGICEFEPSWGSLYAEEYIELKRFLRSKEQVMYFDYEHRMAQSAVVQIRNYIEKNELPIIAVRRKERIYILKKENDENVK
jgi:hypothetical protein